MNILTCISNVTPCPEADQRLLSLSDALDPVSLGVDPVTIAYVFSFGAAAVLFAFSVGYGIAIAIKVVRQI